MTAREILTEWLNERAVTDDQITELLEQLKAVFDE